MTQTEVASAVRDYLKRSGGATVDQLYLGIRGRSGPDWLTRAQIRAALKSISAAPLKCGDWPKYLPDGGRVPPHFEERVRTRFGSDYSDVMGTSEYPEPFTLYRLGGRP